MLWSGLVHAILLCCGVPFVRGGALSCLLCLCPTAFLVVFVQILSAMSTVREFIQTNKTVLAEFSTASERAVEWNNAVSSLRSTEMLWRRVPVPTLVVASHCFHCGALGLVQTHDNWPWLS